MFARADGRVSVRLCVCGGGVAQCAALPTTKGGGQCAGEREKRAAKAKGAGRRRSWLSHLAGSRPTDAYMHAQPEGRPPLSGERTGCDTAISRRVSVASLTLLSSLGGSVGQRGPLCLAYSPLPAPFNLGLCAASSASCRRVEPVCLCLAACVRVRRCVGGWVTAASVAHATKVLRD